MDKWTAEYSQFDDFWVVFDESGKRIVDDLTEPEARAIAASRENAKAAEKVAMYEALLADLLEYFDDRADADQPSGSAPIPNDEMRHAMAIRELLEGEDGGI